MKEFWVDIYEADKHLSHVLDIKIRDYTTANSLLWYLLEQNIISFELREQFQPILFLRSDEVQKISNQVAEAIKSQPDADIISVFNSLYGFSKDYFLKPLPSNAVCLPKCVSMYQLYNIADFTLTGGYDSRFTSEQETGEIVDVIKENSDNPLLADLTLWQGKSSQIWYMNSISLREIIRLLSVRRVSVEQAKCIVRNVFFETARKSENVNKRYLFIRFFGNSDLHDIAEKGLLKSEISHTLLRKTPYCTFSRAELIQYAENAAKQFIADFEHLKEAENNEIVKYISQILNPDTPFVCELKDCICIEEISRYSGRNIFGGVFDSFEVLMLLNEHDLPYTEANDSAFHFVSPSTLRKLKKIITEKD